MLCLALAPFKQYSSHTKLRLPAVTRLRSVIRSSAVPTSLNRSAGLCPRGPYTKRWQIASCHIFYITSQWQVLEILIFRSRSILGNIRSHAETPCDLVWSRSIRPFKRYRRKTGPRKAETDSRLDNSLQEQHIAYQATAPFTPHKPNCHRTVSEEHLRLV